MKFFVILAMTLFLCSCSFYNKEDAKNYRLIAWNDLAMCTDSINAPLIAEAKKIYLHGLSDEKLQNNKFRLFASYDQCTEDYQTCSNLIALAFGRQPLYP